MLSGESQWLLLFIVSLISNLLSSLAGGGTGLLQLPAIIWMGLPFSIALATHKVSTVAMGVGALFYAIKHKNLTKNIMLLLLIAGTPGVLLGANLVLYIPEKLGLVSLGILNIGLAVYSISNKSLGQEASSLVSKSFSHTAIGAAVLFIIGVVNGSLTSGTGLLVTLWLIRWYGLDYRTAIRHTLVIVGILWNFVGAASLALAGEVNWSWATILIPGALIGSWLGVILGGRIDNYNIKKLFELAAFVAGLQLLSKAW
jgi:uncharacterized membrane protein YfcA